MVLLFSKTCLTPPATAAGLPHVARESRIIHRALELLDHPQDVDGVWVDRRKLEEKLGWLRDFRGELGTRQDLEGVISTTLEYIRYAGYHRQADSGTKTR
jgi:hypothetical protein